MFSKSTTIKNDLTMLNVTVVMIAMLFQLTLWVNSNNTIGEVNLIPKYTLEEARKEIAKEEAMKIDTSKIVIPKPMSKDELAKAEAQLQIALDVVHTKLDIPTQPKRKGFDIKPRAVEEVKIVNTKFEEKYKDMDKTSYAYKIMHETPIIPMSQWDEFIADKAREYNVPVSLAFAIINLESEFNPKAVNKSSGATGLGQMLPSTAVHVAKMKGEYEKHKKIFGSDRNAKAFYAKFLKNPENNVDYCVYYLSYLKSTHKTWFRAIKAYSGHYNSISELFVKRYGYKVQKYLINHKSIFRLY